MIRDLIREEEKFPFHANVLKDLYMFAVISMKYDVLFCISTILEVLLDLLISCTLLVPHTIQEFRIRIPGMRNIIDRIDP